MDAKAAPFWFLDAPLAENGQRVDPRTFTRGQRLDEIPTGLTVPVGRLGPAIDFNFGAFDLPVTHARINDALETLAKEGVQRTGFYI